MLQADAVKNAVKQVVVMDRNMGPRTRAVVRKFRYWPQAGSRVEASTVHGPPNGESG